MLFSRHLAIGAGLFLALYPSFAPAADFLIGGGSGMNVHFGVKSMAEMRFHNVIRQQSDFSCGSAAIATLLTHHYGQPTDEKTVLKAMYETGNKEMIRKSGFSLMDMKNYLQTHGVTSNGYRVTLDRIQQVGIPAIALVNHRGYMHFVVIKGVTNHDVLLGDPSFGLRVMPREEFEQSWNGIVFIIQDGTELARHHFNKLEEWQLKRQNVQAYSIDDTNLARSTLDVSQTPNYY
jgi:uncharacterized protein